MSPNLSFRLCRAFTPLLAALTLVIGTRAQSDYATPYTFTTLAGQAEVAGDKDGTGVAARFDQPEHVAVDANGNLYVADTGNNAVRKISPAGIVTTIATQQTYYAAFPFNTFVEFAPVGIAVDAAGNVFVTSDNQVLEITPAGVISTFAGSVQGYADGAADNAQFRLPAGLALDSSGNLYVADYGNFSVRKIASTGVVSTLAGIGTAYGFQDGTGTVARFTNPTDVAVDADGNVYVTDSGAYDIRKVTSAGVVTTLAGSPGNFGSADGTGNAARFYAPNGIAVDSVGNLYVTDADNTIRLVTSAGVVTTLAGTPGQLGSTDGTGAAALFNDPLGIAVDAAGDVFVSDNDDDTIRERYAAAGAVPTLQEQPMSESVALGSTVTFAVTASGVPTPNYQWEFNGTSIAGATNPTLTITDVQASNLGTYTVVVANGTGSVTSAGATLSSPGTSPSPGGSTSPHLVNLSARTLVGTGSSISISGFVISGAAGSTETVLVRGAGPALAAFGVSGGLAQPDLTLSDSTGATIATNANWSANANVAQIVAAETSVGAFELTYGNDDTALLVTLPPGTYTAQVAGQDGTTGVALTEVYEVARSNAQLSNLSNRCLVGTGGNIAIAGLAIAGSGSQQLLIRAVGPTLANYGVTGVLAAPVLTLFDSQGNALATNAGWSTSANAAQVQAAFVAAGAFALPAGSADSALLITLAPGSYSAQVSGTGVATGNALIEVYTVP